MSETKEINFESIGISIRLEIISGQVRLEAPCSVWNTSLKGKCDIGAFTYFNYQCETTETSIGRYCSIGQQVIFNPGAHPLGFVTTHPIASDPSGVSCGMVGQQAYSAVACTALSRPAPARSRCTIGSDVWIGARAIIMAGITIGDGAVIGANSVVTSDIPPYAIAVGSPARVIRSRFDSSIVQRLIATRWWDYDLSMLEMRDYSDVTGFLDRLEQALQNGSIKPFTPTITDFAS